jgi:hypothetical protein
VGTLGAWIALNEILYAKRGVVFGPGYTDVNTQVGMLKLLMGATVFCGITILAFAFRRDWRIPAAGLAVFFAVLVVGTGIYPSLVQKLKVVPNEIALEKPYLEKNIQYTNLAYGLDNINTEFPAEEKRPGDLSAMVTIKYPPVGHAPLLYHSQLPSGPITSSSMWTTTAISSAENTVRSCAPRALTTPLHTWVELSLCRARSWVSELDLPGELPGFHQRLFLPLLHPPSTAGKPPTNTSSSDEAGGIRLSVGKEHCIAGRVL